MTKHYQQRGATMPEALDWYHVTTLSNFAKGYDKYKNQYSKAGIPQSTFPDKFFLLKREELSIGVQKAKKLAKKLGHIGEKLIALKTRLPEAHLHSDHESGVAQYVAQNHIDLDSVYFPLERSCAGSFDLKIARIEDIMAQSLKVLNRALLSWDRLTPRTVSILPIARACQASCRFCFSKASVSSMFSGRIKDWNRIENVLSEAKAAGAKRAVITGGGEPTLVESDQLIRLIQKCSRNFKKVVMITNAYNVANMDDEERLKTLLRWDDAGLSILAISRHFHEESINTHIMGLNTRTEIISETFRASRARFKSLSLRFVCVLQKGGISSVDDVEDYLSWSSQQGVKQVNFKELYVSTGLESAYSSLDSNDYSAEHQVSLSIVHRFVKKHGWKRIAELPWGAPIYQGRWAGQEMKIAAYTEPSVYWERTNGVARSWNLMSDGKVLASLEDPKSEVLQ